MRFSIIFKVLVFIVLSNVLHAQASLSAMAKVPLMTRWKVGESLQYELIKGKIHFTDTTLDNRSELRQNVTLTVLSKNTEGVYSIEAAYGSPALFLPDEMRKFKNADSLVEKYREFKVQYALKPTGEFIGIENVKDIKMMFSDLFDAFAAVADTTVLNKTVLKNMKTQMTTDVYITENLFQELKLYHQFHGLEYAIDQSQIYDTEVANLLDPEGAPIPAKAYLNVGMREGNYCVIDHQLIPDADILKKLVGEYLQKMSGNIVNATATEGVEIDIKDAGKYAFHLQSGWLVEMLKKRLIVTDTEKQEEYVQMRLLNSNF